MYMLLPYAVFILTLMVIIFIVSLYYEYEDYCKKENKSSLLFFIKHLYHYLFIQSKHNIPQNQPPWWKDPYLYLGIFSFVIIGLIAYIVSMVALIAIGYLILLFE